MLLFGHVGITVAIAVIGDKAFPVPDEENEKKGTRETAGKALKLFRDASGYIDYRMVIIGSMLPDIIDKPLFLFFSDSPYIDGRGFSHSLLFQLLVIAGGLLFRKSWPLLLGFGSLMHLVLDSIWNMPVTLFWPFMGWFPPMDSEGWFSVLWENLTGNPKVFIPELIGLIVCAWIGYRILKGEGLIAFLKHGSVI